jgi:uncharacterized protein (TIGR03067 family)
MLLALALLFTCAVLAAPLPKPKPKKKSSTGLEAMQGLWEVKSRVRAKGGAMAVTTTQKYVKIEGNTWTFLRSDATTAGTRCLMQLNPNQLTAGPAPLDLELALNAAGAVRPVGLSSVYYSGLVEVQGDTIRFCYTLRKERPLTMTPQQTGEYLITLERVKK